MIKLRCDEIFIIVFGILFMIGSAVTVGIFSVKYHNDMQLNNQYTEGLSNITNYNITKVDDQYEGWVQFTLMVNDKTCWMYNVSLSSVEEVSVYLRYWYPLYSLTDVYYSNENCALSLPVETWRELGLVVGFSIVFALCLCLILGFIGQKYKYIEYSNAC